MRTPCLFYDEEIVFSRRRTFSFLESSHLILLHAKPSDRDFDQMPHWFFIRRICLWRTSDRPPEEDPFDWEACNSLFIFSMSMSSHQMANALEGQDPCQPMATTMCYKTEFPYLRKNSQWWLKGMHIVNYWKDCFDYITNTFALFDDLRMIYWRG